MPVNDGSVTFTAGVDSTVFALHPACDYAVFAVPALNVGTLTVRGGFTKASMLPILDYSFTSCVGGFMLQVACAGLAFIGLSSSVAQTVSVPLRVVDSE